LKKFREAENKVRLFGRDILSSPGMQKEKGYIPVLAHPERYSYVQEDPNQVMEFIRAGVFIQSNYGSIVGRYGKEAKEFLRHAEEAERNFKGFKNIEEHPFCVMARSLLEKAGMR